MSGRELGGQYIRERNAFSPGQRGISLLEMLGCLLFLGFKALLDAIRIASLRGGFGIILRLTTPWSFATPWRLLRLLSSDPPRKYQRKQQ